jgi:hypothetical protein
MEAPNWRSPYMSKARPRIHSPSSYMRSDGGMLTACMALITSTWAPTDESVTCKVCISATRPLRCRRR